MAYHPFRYLSAVGVHVFTASAAFVGIMSLYKIHQQDYVQALWWMAAAVFIDAIDGTFARLVGVQKVLPQIDGALLDNMVDYLNYVITPCFFLLLKSDMLLPQAQWWVILAISLSSAYQFTQADAKTSDHFFKGFPCYWNIVVFYLFLFQTNPWLNTILLFVLSVLIFVPIKYVYPSRLDYLTNSKKLKFLMHTCSVLYGVSSLLLLATYPNTQTLYLGISFGYIVLYCTLSLSRTFTRKKAIPAVIYNR
ncbi:MAG: phosphatidylcholine synthase [Legionellaceae bacterium]|nr:phosphatidylcholine synthase [Legionellaceae bacterium]